jgi:hypothetical protein
MGKDKAERIYEALTAAGLGEAEARSVADNMGKLPGQYGESDDDIRIVILDANTCLVHGRRVVTVEAAIQIMKMLRESENK